MVRVLGKYVEITQIISTDPVLCFHYYYHMSQYSSRLRDYQLAAQRGAAAGGLPAGGR